MSVVLPRGGAVSSARPTASVSGRRLNRQSFYGAPKWLDSGAADLEVDPSPTAPAMRYAATPFLAALVLAGCSLFGDEGALNVDTSMGRAAISVQNVSDRTVSYLAIETETAARYDLGHPSRWPTLAPGAGYHGPADGFAIGFDEGDPEFVLYWSTGGGLHQERVRL